jgi:hypothetical protein
MAVFKHSLTNTGTLDKLLQLVNSDFDLAIAKSTAWDSTWGDGINELNPPVPKYNNPPVPVILLYKKPIYKTLAVDSQCPQIEFDSCGDSINTQTKVSLINLETTSKETLKILTPNYVYIKVDITPEDINSIGTNFTFRVAGLYKGTTFTLNNAISRLPSTVINQGILYWVVYFTPINSSIFINNKTTSFEILLQA